MSPYLLNRESLRDRTLGSLFGVFIGDALGLPVETMTPAAIKTKFGYVDRYISNKEHKFTSVAKCSPGTISDDSQLTLALIDAIANGKGYDLNRIAASHVEAWEGKWGKPIGWGNSTKDAVSKIKNRQYPTYAPDGGGNGPVMKISPLAIYCVYKTLGTPRGRFTNSFNAALLKKCKELSMLTHGYPMCIVAAYCQCRMIIRALQQELTGLDSLAIGRLFIDDAKYAEGRLNVTWPDKKMLSSRLNLILDDQHLRQTTGSVSEELCTSQGSFIWNSYPLVAYCFAKYAPYRNFRHAIVETINAGADADSNGAMVGAMIGALLGLHAIPMDMLRGLKKYSFLRQLVQNFEQAL